MNLKKYVNWYISELKFAFIENKYLLLVIILLFLVMIFIGYFGSDIISFLMDPMLNSFEEKVSDGTVTLTTHSLFINNFEVILIIFIGSALFAFIGLIILMSNSLFLGYFATKMPIIPFLALTIPHGIFEIPAMILSSFSGLVVFVFIIQFFKDLFNSKKLIEIIKNMKIEKNKEDIVDLDEKLTLKYKIKLAFKNNSYKLKQALVLFILSVILLIIAAFVEANITEFVGLNFLNFLNNFIPVWN